MGDNFVLVPPCPACGGGLSPHEGAQACSQCGRAFRLDEKQQARPD
jgi:hypothetical protein